MLLLNILFSHVSYYVLFEIRPHHHDVIDPSKSSIRNMYTYKINYCKTNRVAVET